MQSKCLLTHISPLQDEKQSPPGPVELQRSIFVFIRAQHGAHSERNVFPSTAVCPAVVQIESVLQAVGLRHKFLHVCKSCEVHTTPLQGDSQSGSWEGVAGVWLVPSSPGEL